MIGISTPNDSVFLATITIRSERFDDLSYEYLGIFANKGAARQAINRRVPVIERRQGLSVVSATVDRGRVMWEGEA